MEKEEIVVEKQALMKEREREKKGKREGLYARNIKTEYPLSK